MDTFQKVNNCITKFCRRNERLLKIFLIIIITNYLLPGYRFQFLYIL
jgi:hypothetical protein